ncbi:hypothetical protein RFI_11451 [Reticulomyxa filosa]|uniref:Uncharacterized protein n=1 Tax=Reticulomyxa filosa TaxID=46433 RepID=X6NH89_RETFI|nr:hypothetical protein RFI_11451 [Reticulomyxa filosa]|eukprot:ETO25685.1 hypothetical protein RFI_11451 [Reticulomyxa filosa]
MYKNNKGQFCDELVVFNVKLSESKKLGTKTSPGANNWLSFIFERSDKETARESQTKEDGDKTEKSNERSRSRNNEEVARNKEKYTTRSTNGVKDIRTLKWSERAGKKEYGQQGTYTSAMIQIANGSNGFACENIGLYGGMDRAKSKKKGIRLEEKEEVNQEPDIQMPQLVQKKKNFF